MRPAWRRVNGTVTPLGWTVLVIGFVAWVLGSRLAWKELLILAAGSLLLVASAIPFIIGRGALAVEVELYPARLTVGESSTGRVRFANRSSRRLGRRLVEIPVGSSRAIFPVRALAADEEAEEIFIVPGERRGVIVVGPATSSRTDPVGLLRRSGTGSEPLELLVHPTTVPLASLGTGLLRDLEGVTTEEVSVSDLAFHSLREYVPGDDRRFVHWRSSARTGRLQVRQFLDTRRSALSIIIDDDRASYADEEEFELALRIGGSVVRRALADDLDVTVVAGDHAVAGLSSRHALDPLARAQLSDRALRLVHLADRIAGRSPGLTTAVLVTGSGLPLDLLRRAATKFAPEVRVIALLADPASSAGLHRAGRISVAVVPGLSELQAMSAFGRVA